MLQRPSLPHKPCKSLPPHCMQAVTSASPLCHVQVCSHPPVTAHKTCCNTALTPSQHSVQAQLRHQPTPQKPCHNTTPTWCASPATMPTCLTQAPPQRARPIITPTHHVKTLPPQHSVQVPPPQPVAHKPHHDTTHHGTMQKPHHQPTTTPPCTPSSPLITSYSS